MLATLIALCLLVGWYLVAAIVTGVVVIIVAVAVVACARERRPGENWWSWFWRVTSEVEQRRSRDFDAYQVLVSCGHRGYVLSDWSPRPGDPAFCCHTRWGPAEEVEVLEVGVIIYDTDQAQIRLGKAMSGYMAPDGP